MPKRASVKSCVEPPDTTKLFNFDHGRAKCTAIFVCVRFLEQTLGNSGYDH